MKIKSLLIPLLLMLTMSIFGAYAAPQAINVTVSKTQCYIGEELSFSITGLTANTLYGIVENDDSTYTTYFQTGSSQTTVTVKIVVKNAGVNKFDVQYTTGSAVNGTSADIVYVTASDFADPINYQLLPLIFSIGSLLVIMSFAFGIIGIKNHRS